VVQTKHRASEFFLAFSSVAVLIVIPTFLIGRFFDPPFNLIGWAIALTIAWLVTQRRDHDKAHPGDWHVRRVSRHGASR
jgi:low temperature requirement protein LtrA